MYKNIIRLCDLTWSACYHRNLKYSRLRCLLHVKGLAICFHLGWSGSILQFRLNIIKLVSNSWLLTCNSKRIWAYLHTLALLWRDKYCFDLTKSTQIFIGCSLIILGCCHALIFLEYSLDFFFWFTQVKPSFFSSCHTEKKTGKG